MKKIMFPLVTLLLASFLLIGMAQAVSVVVTTLPETMISGESTIITVTCDVEASGSITVYTPSGDPYAVPIAVSAGGSDSATYPDDFLGASSSEIGEYEVTVVLSGEEFKASFWVSFGVHMVPEIPIVGTVGAIAAMLSGLGLFIVRKRRPK